MVHQHGVTTEYLARRSRQQMTPLATAGTAEYRTRNVEGRRARADGSDSHEKRENSRGIRDGKLARSKSVEPDFSCLLAPFRGDFLLLPSTFLVRDSSVCFPLVAKFLPEKQAFTHLQNRAARGRNQSELPLEHYWFASRWSLNSC